MTIQQQDAAGSDGEPLARYLARAGRLPVLQGAALAVQLLSVVDTLHRSGLVNAGISRDQLLVLRTGRLALADPGGHARTTVERGGPARSSGRSDDDAVVEVDPRPDVFAAAVVIYELLTGELPFDAAGAAGRCRRPRSESPRSAHATRPELPVQLDAVFERALGPDPDGRYRTAAELSAALQAVLPAPCWTRPHPARPAGPLPAASPSSTLRPDAAAPKVPAPSPATSAVRRVGGARPGLTVAICTAVAASAAALALGAWSLLLQDSRGQVAARVSDAAHPQTAEPAAPGRSAPPAPAPELPAEAAPTRDASRAERQPDTQAAVPGRPDAVAGQLQAVVSVPGSGTRQVRSDRRRATIPALPARRIPPNAARQSPPNPQAACGRGLGVAPELCTALRCATAEFRAHPVCVRMHAEGALARARLAESRGGP